MFDGVDHATRNHLNVSNVERRETTSGYLRTSFPEHLNLSYVEGQQTTSSYLTSTPVVKEIKGSTLAVRYKTYTTPKLVSQTPRKYKRVLQYRPKYSSQLNRNISMYFHLSQSDHLDPWLNLHQFKYLINADICKHNLFVLAFVHSSPYKLKERNQIRTTWGGYKVFKGKHFRTVFMLGDPQNGTLQRIIVEEAKKYKDIVQGDFKDTYRNLTYKQIMGLSWSTRYCPNVSYILKTDDDIMVNVYNMVDYLTNTNPTKNFLYCGFFASNRPYRQTASKWKVSHLEYPFLKYPTYCEGFAYIITPDVAVQFLKVSKDAKFFWIDDVFISGILNIVAEVPFTRFEMNHGYDLMLIRHSGTNVRNVMFILIRYHFARKFWYTAWQAISKYG